MRPTIVQASEMPGPQRAWSSWWGSPFVKQRGITQYTLSPLSAKAGPNWLRNYVFNFYRRVSVEAVYFVVPFALGYSIYTWANHRYAFQNSKAGHIAGAHH
ncbi:hypothetical protein D9757_005823 [Collybiopsis confluens]|uniref:Cytochrome b-c1 complex subunit 8 n=1 Tax=Collybiopsis confluens TaxID=2823264 RepID=A0A8H5HN52_9AGAR|nr:hypothetical protein D9757_005823 [Collybiopsis confluens]